MSTQSDKLLALADDFQKKADGLRYAAQVLNESGTASVVKRLPTAMATALAMREEARAYQKTAAVEPAPTTPSGAKPVRVARQESAQLLAKFSRKTPRPGTGGPRLSSLLQHGYLIRNAKGLYLRTSKPYSENSRQLGTARKGRPHKHRSPSDLKKAAARDDKARIVATILKDHGPMTGTEVAAAARQFGVTNLTGIYAYVQRGYITKVQDGKKGGTSRYAFQSMPPSTTVNGTEGAASS